MKLHLGAFDQVLPGWVNTDISPHIWVSRIPFAAFFLSKIGAMSKERYSQHHAGIFKNLKYLDVRKRFPYPDNSVDAIFSSHLIEHLYQSEAQHIIRETLRVLRWNGVARFSAPNLTRQVEMFLPESPEPMLKAVFEATEPGRHKNAHHWAWTAEYLIRTLKEIGFSEAYECTFRQGRCPDVAVIDSRPEESFFVEGVK